MIFHQNYPAPAVAGASPPKNQGNREARSAIYATAAMPIFNHVFLLFLDRFDIVNEIWGTKQAGQV